MTSCPVSPTNQLLLGPVAEPSTQVLALAHAISAKQMLTLVLDALPVALFWKDLDSRILGCNQKFADDSGVSHPADLVGRTNFDFYPPEQAKAFRADDLEVMTSGQGKLGIEESLLLGTGETAWVETNKVPMLDRGGKIVGVLGTYRDITTRRRASEDRMRLALELSAAKQASAAAMLDNLTGLPNRRGLYEELHARLNPSASSKRLAVAALDLDRFKAVNDLYGRAAGDDLLRKVGSLLSLAAGSEGFVARTGGNEFVLLLNCDSQVDLVSKLSSLINTFGSPIELSTHNVSVGISLGVSTTADDKGDADHLMHCADLALDSAKEHGRMRFEFFEPGMESRAQERALLERDLRVAVKADQIIPYFQPLVELATGNVSSYEVLARWPHPERGLIPPDNFIRVAEESGLIDQITLNLLRRACRETIHWVGEPRIALNIAPIQLLDPALPLKFLSVLSECGFPPGRLDVEITEDAIITDIDVARETLSTLKKLGVRIALDDFGVGYSSLKNLREFSFDTLKIDKSFVQSLDAGGDALAIVKAILQMARTLGLEVTAEGIETESQVATLHALGCKRGQGFYLGLPKPGPVGRAVYASQPPQRQKSA